MTTKTFDNDPDRGPMAINNQVLRPATLCLHWLSGAMLFLLPSALSIASEQSTAVDPTELLEQLRDTHAEAEALMPKPDELVTPQVYIHELFKIPDGDNALRPPEKFSDEQWQGIVFSHYHEILQRNVAIDGALRVVDQRGRGVPQVQVVAQLLFQDPSLERWFHDEPPYTKTALIGVLTDDNGDFSFKGWHVQSISLLDVKGEAVFATWPLVSGGATSTRDARNPDVPNRLDKTIKVWRIQPADGEVVEHSFRGYLEPQETAHYFNLRSGELVDDPQDADIAIVYGIDMDAPGPVQRRPWTMEIHVPGGGIQSSDMPYLFEAPEDGYQPLFTRSHEDPRAPVPAPDLRLYVRHRDSGMHSAIEGRVGAWRDGRLQLNLNWRTNLDGGRLLQPPDATDPPE